MVPELKFVSNKERWSARLSGISPYDANDHFHELPPTGNAASATAGGWRARVGLGCSLSSGSVMPQYRGKPQHVCCFRSGPWCLAGSNHFGAILPSSGADALCVDGPVQNYVCEGTP